MIFLQNLVTSAVALIVPCLVLVQAYPPTKGSYTSDCSSLECTLPDGTYVGDSRPDTNLVSYRLVVTMSKAHIVKADFRLLFDGFDWGSGTASYINENDIDPGRRAVFLPMESVYNATAIAATEYNTRLVGLRSPSQIPPPDVCSNLTSLYKGLIDCWAALVELKLQLIEHVNVTTLGDNNGAPHSWNEYIPHCARQNPSRKVPLVLSLHGSGNTIVKAEGLLFPFIGAEPENCFISLVPDDSSQLSGIANWNVAPDTNNTMLSDVDFLLALIKHEQRERSIDPTRIYLTGISNGAAMSTYLSMLHPELFAGVASIAGAVGCSGGSYNEPFLQASKAVLSAGIPLLPVIAGAGTVDNVNFLTPLRQQGNYTVVKPCYENQMAWWKAYNGIEETTWNPNYFFGQELDHTYEYRAYGYDIQVGDLSPPPKARSPYPLLKFYAVYGMFHDDPNPSIGELSWNFLRRFSRSSSGSLLRDGLPLV